MRHRRLPPLLPLLLLILLVGASLAIAGRAAPAPPAVSPYRALAADKRLFDPDVAFKPFDRRFNWKNLAESPMMDDPDDMRAGFREPDDRNERDRDR